MPEISAVTDVRVNNDDTELRTRSRARASSGREGHGTTRNQHHTDKKNILFQRERWDRLQRGGLRQLAFPSLPPTPRNATQRIAKSTLSLSIPPIHSPTAMDAAQRRVGTHLQRPPPPAGGYGLTVNPTAAEYVHGASVALTTCVSLPFPSSVCQFRSAPPRRLLFRSPRAAPNSPSTIHCNMEFSLYLLVTTRFIYSYICLSVSIRMGPVNSY